MRKFHRAPALIFLLVATGSAHAPLGLSLSGDIADARDTPPFLTPDSGTPLQAANDPAPPTDTFINSGPTSDEAALAKILDTLIANAAPPDLPNLFPPRDQNLLSDTSLTPSNFDPKPGPQIDPGPDLSPPGGGGPVAIAADVGGGGAFDAPPTGGGGNGTPAAPAAPGGGTPVPEPTSLWMVAGATLAFLRPRARRV